MSVLEKFLKSDFSSKDKKTDLDLLDELFSGNSTNKSLEKKQPLPTKESFLDLDKIDDTFLDLFLEDEDFQFLSSNDSTENKINSLRSRILDKKFTNDFLSILREEDFEFGFISRSEELLNEQLKINALATRNWLNELFIKHFSDEVIIIGILRIIGRFEPTQIFPQGQTIALAALNHSNDEVKELGIRAFEKWCNIESLEILKKIQVETIWLREYIEEVIKDFEEQLCHY
ncbi:MAG: hypothetical protein EA412_01205 [Chitinophagaceae bacterium]|nr:MAG: hypothetical protein EA412_01205 [Chitinophagaceae bacterium]